MKAVAVIILALCAITLFYGPFMIGKPKKPETPGGYVIGILLIIPQAILALHVLGLL